MTASCSARPGVTLVTIHGKTPRIDPSAFIAPGCRIIGDVTIGPEATVWYNCVLRGDLNRLVIGARTNVQDGTVIHCDPPEGDDLEGSPTLIGDDVLIGHMAMIHGCVLEDRAFVGLGSIVMDKCRVAGDAMLAAGAMLTPGKVVSSGEMWAGRPAKLVRPLRDEEIANMRKGVARYVENGRNHAAALASNPA